MFALENNRLPLTSDVNGLDILGLDMDYPDKWITGLQRISTQQLYDVLGEL